MFQLVELTVMTLWGFECKHCDLCSSQYLRSPEIPDRVAPVCKCGYKMEPFIAAEPASRPPAFSSTKHPLPKAKAGRRTAHKFPSPGGWSAKDRSINRNGRRLK